MKILEITIPKDYDFSDKYKTITTKGMFAFHYTKNKPKQDYDLVNVIHNGTEYLCRKYNTEKGIGFHELMDEVKTGRKGFQGFRYSNNTLNLDETFDYIEELVKGKN